MYPYEPAEFQPCYYCKKISKIETEPDYPIREGIYTYEKVIYRCAWHARFECAKCGETKHYNWFYWCPKSEELVCGKCNPPTLKPVKFWDRTYAYEFQCEVCGDVHYDLLFSEFKGTHPWQQGSHKLKAIVDDSEPWQPIWRPGELQHGEDIDLETALKLENKVWAIREAMGFVQVHSEVTPDHEVQYTEAQDRWVTTSEAWLEFLESRGEKDEGDVNRQWIIDPALWKLMGDVSGLSVLDAGCGNGYLSRKLARAGASVVGVDYSINFIDYCKKRDEELQLGCKFIHGSITELSELASDQFDLVVSNIVMIDVIDYNAAFKEIARVLKKDGRFIWSNTHPVFAHMGAMDLKMPFDSQRNEERWFKIIDRYFDSGGTLISWGDIKPIWQFDRTLEEYSRALKDAGFAILEICEPRPSKEMIQKHPRHLAFDADRYTHFIIFECKLFGQKG